MQYGLIGKKLSHSHSPAIHSLLGNKAYALLELPEEGVDAYLRGGDYLGVNVTIPYKERAFALCECDEIARAIGSVNTVIRREGRLLGYNTDAAGFLYMVKKAGISLAGKKALILGSGGTSKTAVYVAKQEGAREIIVVSRGGENNYENIGKHRDSDVLINTTPVGMYPDGAARPIALSGFDRLSGVADVIYNPLHTNLVLEAKEMGIPATGGLAMLIAQAYFADRLFFDKPEGENPQAELDAAYEAYLRKMRNIVLIGMPGCGKTTMGRAIAERLGREWADTDEIIAQTEGRSPAEIIRAHGEAHFREIESLVVRAVSQKTGAVIATGGGSVLSMANRRALAQNGFVVFLDRDVSQLATRDRPLSSNLEALEAARRPVYEGFADLTVPIRGDITEDVDNVLEGLR